jgi:transcriptional regulator with XRE-family HTH domain
METPNYIGYNILQYRTLTDLTQQQIADYLGVTRELISLIEKGKREISLSNLNKLANLFGTELEDLLEEDMQMANTKLAFAFRSEETEEDLEQIAAFKKIVLNYLKMDSLRNDL